MYRLSDELRDTIKTVMVEYEARFGYPITFDMAFEIYKSQTRGVLHYMTIQEPVKMRGLLVFYIKPSRKETYQVADVNKIKVTKRVNGKYRVHLITYKEPPFPFNKPLIF